MLGSGNFTYTPDPSWGSLPAGMMLGDVAAVAVDAKDNVFLFNRGRDCREIGGQATIAVGK